MLSESSGLVTVGASFVAEDCSLHGPQRQMGLGVRRMSKSLQREYGECWNDPASRKRASILSVSDRLKVVMMCVIKYRGDLEVARSEAEAKVISRSSFIYSEAAYATALDSSIGAERRGPHTPREAPGENFDKDTDYQLQRALDVLKAGGDLADESKDEGAN